MSRLRATRARWVLTTIGCAIVMSATSRVQAMNADRNVPIDSAVDAPVSSAQSGAMSRPVPAPGVDTVLDARAKAIASRLRCPVCQGESIQDSPAELAAQMKGLVREQLANGRSETEVLDYFTQKYGQWILLEPQASGLNLIVYWIPVLFLVFGGGALWMVVRRWTQPRAHTPSLAGADVGADIVSTRPESVDD